MSAFGFDPEDLFRFPRRGRPRVVRPGLTRPPQRVRRILLAVGVLIVLLVLVRVLMNLRVSYLFFDHLGHTNVFWTPFVAQVILFLVGFVITAVVVGVSIPGWRAAARTLDVRGGKLAVWAGIAITLIAALVGGGFLSSQWQDVLLWLHGHRFGATDPVFHEDFSFFLFTLPVLDDLQALAWAGALIGLLVAAAIALLCLAVDTAPADVDIPLQTPPDRGPGDGMRIAVLHAGICLVAVFILAALGAHFGVYHLTTSQHDQFVGLDATQRNVVRPVLGALQVIALLFAVATVAILVLRWRRSVVVTASVFGGLLGGWLVLAGALQGIPAAVYQGTSVNPNALTAQTPSINDFLSSSRTGWALQDGRDVELRPFGNPTPPQIVPPSLDDLLTEPGTLRNVRIQDYRQLPETFAQIDRTRTYQSYPTITVDRYSNPANQDGSDTEVMIGPREIAEEDLPSSSFINRSLLYTHGYGITAVSVNRVAAEGKPDVLVGQQPLQQVSPDAPPDLYFKGAKNPDPRIYCGIKTTQPVVVNTTQNEFDYPSGTGDHTSHAGTDVRGIGVQNPFDKLALSLNEFNGFDLFLTSALTPDSRVLFHRTVSDRISTLAPFLTVDGDPYIVADAQTGHLMYIVDAYISSARFPSSYRQDDGTSYMRNAVKAVVDAKTCDTTLYAVDPNEPLTAAYSEIYPGLLTPLDKMPSFLRSHLRYPEDMFSKQARVYALVHVRDASVFFNNSDRYRVADEIVENTQQESQAYYVEYILPGETTPRFVLLQNFSPASSGGGTSANNLTATMSATCDYVTSNHPKLEVIRLNNALNVLGPLQFDNNINTDPKISTQRTLLGQTGSQVKLGNVIVLPFRNHSFLYVRPLYVLATSTTGGSFPQLRFVIVGTQTAVAFGSSFADALQTLYNQPIPQLGALLPPGQGVTAAPGPGTTPAPSGPTPSPSAPVPTASAGPSLPAGAAPLLQDLLLHQQNAEAALGRGDFATAGQEQAAVKKDADQLRTLVGSGAPGGGTPAASPPP